MQSPGIRNNVGVFVWEAIFRVYENSCLPLLPKGSIHLCKVIVNAHDKDWLFSMTSYTKHRFHVLDGFRGIAAIMVMFFHYYNQLYLRCLKNQFLAVDFFFILSGFVVFHAYGEKLLNGMPKAEYIARRISRLYPMAVIGILIGVPAFYIHTVLTPTDFTRHDIISSLASNLALLPYLTEKTQLVDSVTRNVPIFPADTPLWSIFFEMLASICFLAHIHLREKQLRTFCITCLSVLFIASVFHGFTVHKRMFDMDAGWQTDNFLGGFPRLFYGFSAGMLIYLWRFSKAPLPIENMRVLINPWLLYGGLVVMLAFPSYMQGVYDLFAVAVLAPLLVWFGSISICRNRLTMKISEFLGWLSFPLYCLHMPVFEEMKILNGTLNFSGNFGISPQLAALVTTLLLSVIVGVTIDRLEVQRRFTNLLSRHFAALVR